MSIEQTKLFKKRVETPELRTNTFTSENLQGNNILADTIWFAGHDLEDTLFGDNIEEIVIDPIEIISKTNTEEISYGAEQIIAFQMKVSQDYKGKYMTSVTLRRCDTNTGSGKPVAQLEQVYLYANCMNSEGEVIDTFYSFDKHKQSQDDGLQTTWNFEEPIKISKDYEFIRFYCTRVRGEAQTDVNLRSSNINISNTKQYINGWKTVDQASIKEFTTDFCVNVYQRTTGLLDHVNDTIIHVTAEDKERWNNIVIPEIPEQIVYQSGNNVAISDDNVISVITTDVVNESDMIPTSKAVHEIFYETHQFNNYDSSKYTYLPDTVGTIVLSKKHFISGGKITKVTIPHGNTQEDITNGQGGFLVIDVFKEDNSYPEGYNINSPSHRFWADEYYAYKNRLNEGHYEWTFNERDCIIPDDYKVVHLSLVVDEANVSKVGVGSATNAKFRINCLAKNGNRDEGVVYEEDDECKLYWQGGTNGANRIAIVEVEYKVKTLDVSKIAELSSSIENHISSDVHLSSSDKTNISKVSQLETSINNHTSDDTHVTTDEKDLLQTLVVPQTRLFSTKTDEMTTDEYANCLYFSISKKHFTQGKLQKIEIPYKSGGSVYSKVWLCLQFYNSATEVKTFEDCIFSKNYQNQTNTGGTLVFEFDNVQIPYEYSFVKIMLAQNSTPNSEEPPTTLPSGNVELRVTPLKTTTLTFDLDECEVKGKNGTIYNWLVYLNAETKISFLDEYSLLLQEVKELKNRIEQLESNP